MDHDAVIEVMLILIFLFFVGLIILSYSGAFSHECPEKVCFEPICECAFCHVVPDTITKIEKVEVCTPEEIMTECTLLIENAKMLEEMLE